jgi:hypothetical protein
MQGVVRTCLLLGVIAGCHTTDPSSPDGGSHGSDGSDTSDNGLTITWAARPATIPGDAGSDITVSSMLFRVSNLRVIGDAGPGDTRTSADSLSVAWAQGVAPNAIPFDDAPTGLYSRVVMLADGGLTDYSYEIAGTAKVNGNAKPFRIHDLSPLGISIDTDTMLDPGRGVSLGIIVRIDQALQSISFGDLRDNNGTLVLETFDSAMNDFRKKMMSSVFETDHPSGETH